MVHSHLIHSSVISLHANTSWPSFRGHIDVTPDWLAPRKFFFLSFFFFFLPFRGYLVMSSQIFSRIASSSSSLGPLSLPSLVSGKSPTLMLCITLINFPSLPCKRYAKHWVGHLAAAFPIIACRSCQRMMNFSYEMVRSGSKLEKYPTGISCASGSHTKIPSLSHAKSPSG